MQSDGRRTVLVVLGDHGMTEQGNHGGNSALETRTALLVLSPEYRGGAGGQCMYDAIPKPI
jgi:ethanolaminephosphotransferase